MRFKAQITVVGLKASKGTLDNGNAFDSTKAFCLVDMDARKGNMRGQSAEEFNIGTSDVYGTFAGFQLPFLADAEFEIVTNGKTQQTIIHGLVPIKPKT